MAALDIDLSDTGFWGRSLPDRDAAFARLRALGQPAFFAEPDRLLSAFINGIKRMPCEFSTAR